MVLRDRVFVERALSRSSRAHRESPRAVMWPVGVLRLDLVSIEVARGRPSSPPPRMILPHDYTTTPEMFVHDRVSTDDALV